MGCVNMWRRCVHYKNHGWRRRVPPGIRASYTEAGKEPLQFVRSQSWWSVLACSSRFWGFPIFLFIYLLFPLFHSICLAILLLHVLSVGHIFQRQISFHVFSFNSCPFIPLPAFQLGCFLIFFCSHVYPGVAFLFILTLDTGSSL